jgi:NAD(P)-dependent dehydrogenase (short-subunit alcohol dehydrogenase family)
VNGRLEGKIAIVTGAGRGIGRAVARRFAGEGAAVSICDVDESLLAETRDLILEQGGRVVASRCDVAVRSDLEAMVTQTVDEFGAINIVVNNAQRIPPPTPAEDVTDEIWDPVEASGARATWMCCQLAFPYLRRQGGSIVNFSSAAGLVGAPWLLPYAATKGAIVALTHTLAQEWGRFGIRVNAVAPGAITPATELLAKQLGERIAQTGELPPRGVATSEHLGPVLAGSAEPDVAVAPAILFFASDEASHITGQVMCVDGGVVMH